MTSITDSAKKAVMVLRNREILYLFFGSILLFPVFARAYNAEFYFYPSSGEFERNTTISLTVLCDINIAIDFAGIDAGIEFDPNVFSEPSVKWDYLTEPPFINVGQGSSWLTHRGGFHYSKISMGRFPLSPGSYKIYELGLKIKKDAPVGKTTVRFVDGFYTIIDPAGPLTSYADSAVLTIIEPTPTPDKTTITSEIAITPTPTSTPLPTSTSYPEISPSAISTLILDMPEENLRVKSESYFQWEIIWRILIAILLVILIIFIIVRLYSKKKE